MLAAWAVFRFPLTFEAAALIAVLTASLLATAAVGLMWVGIVLRYRDGWLVTNLFVFATSLLAGPGYPTSILPEWAQAMG